MQRIQALRGGDLQGEMMKADNPTPIERGGRTRIFCLSERHHYGAVTYENSRIIRHFSNLTKAQSLLEKSLRGVNTRHGESNVMNALRTRGTGGHGLTSFELDSSV